MIGGGGGAGGGGDDFSELQEMTAGGRRIATSRAAQRSLPWDVGAMGAPRSGSASRVSDRSSVSSLEGVLEEGNGGNGRGRGRGAPRIDKFDGAVPPGPFSDPFPAGRHDPNGGGSGPGSPVREIEAGEAAKIAMWLPGAAGGTSRRRRRRRGACRRAARAAAAGATRRSRSTAWASRPTMARRRASRSRC